MDNAIDNRKRLIKMAKGEPQFYRIEYSMDIKGNITIWGGEPCENIDMFVQIPTEDYLHLYDGWNRGGELARKEREMADNTPREEFVRAFLEFRKTHPFDGYGLLYKMGQDIEDGTRRERDDKAEVKKELKKRNRQYIFELYGEKLPLDFDFEKDYQTRMAKR